VVATEDVVMDRLAKLLALFTSMQEHGLVGIVLVVFAAGAALVRN
jgi:hypothetical protein